MTKKFKVAVAGCGGMANTWVKYAGERTDTEIVALVDIDPDNIKKMAEKHNLDQAQTFSELKRAINETNPDLVFDITPPEVHYNIVTTALNEGCNVLGEKPMASSFEQAKEMVALAEKTGNMYAVMQNRRYLHDIRAYRDLIDSGVIGKPGFITADFFIGAHFKGFRTEMESPLILDMAIHTFDQARLIMDADPVSVYCHEFNPEGSWYDGDAAAVCTFEFDNGSVFSYRGSWCAEGAQTSWESSWRVTGSKGSAIWDGHNKPYAEVVKESDEEKFMNDYNTIEAEYNWEGREGHEGCLDEMFTALKENRKAETDCTDNIKSMAMVFGAIESSRKEKKIDIEI
ncbi:MAG: Gfo/Idh/MocA family protein [Halanaerobiaceae bacterium]